MQVYAAKVYNKFSRLIHLIAPLHCGDVIKVTDRKSSDICGHFWCCFKCCDSPVHQCSPITQSALIHIFILRYIYKRTIIIGINTEYYGKFALFRMEA